MLVVAITTTAEPSSQQPQAGLEPPLLVPLTGAEESSPHARAELTQMLVVAITTLAQSRTAQADRAQMPMVAMPI